MSIVLGANWLKAIVACLDVKQLGLVVGLEKLKLKKLPCKSEDFVYIFSVYTQVIDLQFLYRCYLVKGYTFPCATAEDLLFSSRSGLGFFWHL